MAGATSTANAFDQTDGETKKISSSFPERAFEEDMGLLYEANRLLFTNDLPGAESLCRVEMEKNPREMNEESRDSGSGGSESQSQPETGLRDSRPGFALLYAFVSVIKGIASLSNDQLDECLERLWAADEMANSGPDQSWIIRDTVRGIATLMGGVVQVMQHNFVKGGYNICRSWIWLRVLKERALDFEGKERKLLRSLALFALGLLDILLSLLPRSVLKAASFLGGTEGDRDAGLGKLLTCWREGGLFATYGALVWTCYQVDTKTFLNEPTTAQELQILQEVISWSKQTYPDGVFFALLEANFVASQRDVTRSLVIYDRCQQHVTELRGLDWLLNYKRGVYELVRLNFVAAATYFENSIQIYVQVGRRSMVPFMAMYCYLCNRIITNDSLWDSKGDSDPDERGDTVVAQADAKRMLSLVREYKNMDKKNWGYKDRWAFDMLEEYCPNASEEIDAASHQTKTIMAEQSGCPLLDMVESMCLRMRCTPWMDESRAERLVELLRTSGTAGDSSPAKIRIKSCGLFAHLELDRQQYETSLQWCKEGLSLAKNDDESECETNDHAEDASYVALLQYIQAFILLRRGELLASQHTASQLEEQLKKGGRLQHYILFKTNILKKELDKSSLRNSTGGNESGDEDNKGYVRTEVTARSQHQENLAVKEGETIKWDWAVQSRDIGFSVAFRPLSSEGEGNPQVISMVDRHAAEDGPLADQFTAKTEGKLLFVWDNSFSYLRSKSIIFRIEPLCREIEVVS